MNKPIRIAITPLSPLHIGCGEDYEPTNYVVDVEKRLLYGFNPSVVHLEEPIRKSLLKAAKKADSTEIYDVYKKNLESFRPWAQIVVPMDSASVLGYKKMLEPKGRQKATKFEVSRSTYEVRVKDGRVCNEVYIPGSSLKGTIKTALVDRLNQGRKIENEDIDDNVLGGSFATSPLRFLKVADLHPNGTFVETKIRCAMRFYKKEPQKNCLIPGAYFETIEPWQFRAFKGDLILASDRNKNNTQHVYASITELIRDLNRYSEKIWDKEVRWYHRADSDWAKSVEDLRSHLQEQMKAGRVALLRLGKNAGAESKTLSGGVSRIEIRHRNKTQTYTTTMWLLPETASAPQNASRMPFGWALMEVLEDDKEDETIKSWCDGCTKDSSGKEVLCEYEYIKKERKAIEDRIQAMRLQQQLEEDRRRQAEKEREQAEKEKEERLAKLSPEKRSIEKIIEELEKTPGMVNPGTDLHRDVTKFLEKAQEWTDPEDKKELAEKIGPYMKRKGLYQGKFEKKFKGLLKKLRGE